MEALLQGLIVFVVVFVLLMGVYFIALLRNRKKLGVFQTYIQQHFPDLPTDTPMLAAKQRSKAAQLDIGLMVHDEKKEIIIVQSPKGQEMTHKIFKFGDLAKVESSNQMLERGILPKTYSYEQALKLTFKDDSKYRFVLENISNKYGNDRGADLVRETLAPFERKLKDLVK